MATRSLARRLIHGLVEARGVGSAGKPRGADREIDRERGDGERGGSPQYSAARAGGLRRRREPRLLLRASDEAARHLDAGGLGIRAGDQAFRALGLDLGELVAVDVKLLICRRGGGPGRQ